LKVQYFIFLSLVTFSSYANEMGIKEAKNIEKLQEAFVKCEVKEFLALKPAEYFEYSKESILDARFDSFLLNMLNESEDVKPSCKNILKLLAQNGFKFYHPNTILKILSLHSTMAINEFIENKLISDLVIEGSIEKFSYILGKFKNAELITFYEFQIYKEYFEHFMKKFPEKKRVDFKPYHVGEIYYLCGFNQNARIYKRDKTEVADSFIRKCALPYTSVSAPFAKDNEFEYENYGDGFYGKIISINDDWIQIQEYGNTSSERHYSEDLPKDTVWVKDSTVVSFYFLTDGEQVMPLPNYQSFELYLNDSVMLCKNEYAFSSDDQREVFSPVFEVISPPATLSPGDLSIKKLVLPKTFKAQKAKLINNVNFYFTNGNDGC